MTRIVAVMRALKDAIVDAGEPSDIAGNANLRIQNKARRTAIKEAIFYHLKSRMNWRIANDCALEGDAPQLQYPHLADKMSHARDHELKALQASGITIEE